MKRLIIFLIRMRLGLKKGETFQFTNQKTNDIYYFTDTALTKKSGLVNHPGIESISVLSGVSLNWLLDKECEIRKVGDAR